MSRSHKLDRYVLLFVEVRRSTKHGKKTLRGEDTQLQTGRKLPERVARQVTLVVTIHEASWELCINGRTVILSLTSFLVNCECFRNCQFKGRKAKVRSSLHLSLAIPLYSCSRYPYGRLAERQRGRGPLPGISDSHKCVKEEK